MPTSRVVAVLVAVAVLGALVGAGIFALADDDSGGGAGSAADGSARNAALLSTVPGRAPTNVASTPGDKALGPSQVYDAAKDSVAFITADLTGTQQTPFGPQPGRGQATGTGFVVAPGSVATNAHVIDRARTVSVKVGDGAVHRATIVGKDNSTDVALLHVDTGSEHPRPLAFADSGRAVVGEPAYAIGNPFGLDRTMTAGIVSALQREITAPNGFAITGAIQTDAAINPGNSGGPLLDSRAAVIGITSQILTGGSASEGNVGIGFAVPSNTAREVIQQLDLNGQVQHAYLGVETTDAPNGAGALVVAVTPGGPAAGAGVRAGDVIVAFDGRRIADAESLSSAVNASRPGQQVRLTLRRGSSERTVTVTLARQPASASRAGGTP